VLQGAFKAGDALYRVADLATVWVYLELYEMDLASVRYGQEVELRAEAWPGEVFHGQVTFINPVLDEATRTVKVPVHVANPDGRLRPGMFVSAVIRAPLLADGRAAPTGVEGRFSCPMHPQVLAAAAGACPLCEMPLRQIPPLAPPVAPADRLALAVPASAVLDSGVRQLVFVEVEKGHFRATPVTLGPRAGDWYMVLAGLAAGDEVAVRGNLLLDSQFQIQGLPSALTPPPAAGSPGPTPAAPPPPPPGHQH
jgi:Cu(I)/Ag(I) efflux system membrane fusion protein